jgi:hypothetical protein
MKKLFVGLLIGLVAGGAGAWLLAHRPAAADAPKEAAAPEKPKDNPLHLPPAKREAAGIKLAKPSAVTIAPEVPAYGRVLDPTPFITLAAEVNTARAALAATEKEVQRASKLFAAGGNASAQAVETAEANVARDRAALASAQSRLVVTWGHGVVDQLEKVVTALNAGGALVRLDVLPGERIAPNPTAAQITVLGTDERFSAEILGPAPVADAQVQGTSLLALVSGHALAAGSAVRATISGSGEATHALVVPADAIVYHQGSAWVFVLGEEDTFERKLVTVGQSAANGSAISAGIEPDEQIVVAGAQQLLSAELQAGGAPVE